MMDEFAEYVHEVLDPHMEGMIVTRQEIEGWTDTFYGTEWRVARHPKNLTGRMSKPSMSALWQNL